MIATCHTRGCDNADEPIEVGDLTYTDDVTGEEMMMGVACGVCGQPIEDVAETPEPEPPEQPDRPDNELPEHPEPR